MHNKRVVLNFTVHNSVTGSNWADWTLVFPNASSQSDLSERAFVRRITLQSHYWYLQHTSPLPMTWGVGLYYVYMEHSNLISQSTSIDSIDFRPTEDPIDINTPGDSTQIWHKVNVSSNQGSARTNLIQLFTFSHTTNVNACKIRSEWIAKTKKLALPLAKCTGDGSKFHLGFHPMSTAAKPANSLYALECEMELSI